MLHIIKKITLKDKIHKENIKKDRKTKNINNYRLTRMTTSISSEAFEKKAKE